MALNKSPYEDIIRNKLKVTSGLEFQNLFWRIAKKIYHDLETPQTYHDLGNDCYSLDSEIFFQCYAPENLHSKNQTVKKIEDDYESFNKNWQKSKKFKKWIFVTNNEIPGKAHIKLVDLNTLKDGIKKENWALEQILNLISQLDEKDVHTIFNLPDHKLYSATQSIEFWPKGNEYLNLDNMGILRFASGPYDFECITLALNHVPYEIEKPKPGQKISYGNFQIGAEVNKGENPNIKMANVSITMGEVLDKFTFGINKQKTHVINIGIRKFRVTLISIKEIDKANVAKPMEYKFSISEEI